MKRTALRRLMVSRVSLPHFTKHLAMATAILVCGAMVFAKGEPAPSKEMSKIVAERFGAQAHSSPVQGLKRLHFDDIAEIEKLAKFEKYRIPHRFGLDVIEYEIWRSSETGAYLILMTGGEMGLLEVFGVGVPQQATPGVRPSDATNKWRSPTIPPSAPK